MIFMDFAISFVKVVFGWDDLGKKKKKGREGNMKKRVIFLLFGWKESLDGKVE